jgi:undecaprenyl-diphosphatase
VSLRSLKQFENTVSLRLQETAKSAWARRTWSVVAHSGDSAVVVPCLFVLWWLHGFSRQSLVIPVAVGFALSVVATSIVKFTVRRRRPAGDWGAVYRKIDPHSFPSGHASRTITMTIVLMAGGYYLIGAALLFWSLLVGLSRIILGVHYLYDVLAGYLLGVGVGVGIWLLMTFDILF